MIASVKEIFQVERRIRNDIRVKRIVKAEFLKHENLEFMINFQNNIIVCDIES